VTRWGGAPQLAEAFRIDLQKRTARLLADVVMVLRATVVIHTAIDLYDVKRIAALTAAIGGDV
jgi:hypothetical protein